MPGAYRQLSALGGLPGVLEQEVERLLGLDVARDAPQRAVFLKLQPDGGERLRAAGGPAAPLRGPPRRGWARCAPARRCGRAAGKPSPRATAFSRWDSFTFSQSSLSVLGSTPCAASARRRCSTRLRIWRSTSASGTGNWCAVHQLVHDACSWRPAAPRTRAGRRWPCGWRRAARPRSGSRPGPARTRRSAPAVPCAGCP